MKKLLIAVSLISLLLLTGCASDPTEKTAVSLVLGNHANSQGMPYSSTVVINALEEATSSFGAVSLVGCDGDPYSIASVDIPEQQDGLSDTKYEDISDSQVSQILTKISSWSAQTEEVDTLSAIFIAVRDLSNIDCENKTLIICDTGLQTTGVLNFSSSDLLSIDDVSGIVDILAEGMNIPDLSGINLLWIGLGDTDFPQEDLTRAQLKKLEEIWEAILSAGNPVSLTFSTVNPDVNYQVTDVPLVSLVSAAEDLTPTVDSVLDEPLIFYQDSTISFNGNENTFEDESLAIETLQSIAELMFDNDELELLVVGTTASGRVDFCNELSTARAVQVVQTLVSLGVDESRLIAIGLGFEDEWHIDDLNSDGTLNANAYFNRKVVILNAETEQAQNIISNN